MTFCLGINLLLIVLLAKSKVITENSYLAANIDKHHILQQTLSPKFIFLGGSNVAFGLDSPQIEEKFGMAVVNMGLAADLGLEYMVDEIKPDIRQDDIIMLSPEYTHFYGSFLDGGETLLYTMIVFPQGLIYVHSPGEYQALLSAVPTLVQLSTKRWIADVIVGTDRADRATGKIYNRNAFNSNGDMVAHLDEPSPVDISRQPSLFGSSKPSIDPESVQVLNDFEEYALAQGARAYFVFPSLSETQYKADEITILELYAYLKQHLSMPILSPPDRYAFSPDSFYDTIYHLNRKGLSARMQRLIEDMQTALIQPSHSAP